MPLPLQQVIVLPPNTGSNGQVLQTDGTGITTWVNATGTGTVNSGTASHVAYYATSSNILSDSGISVSNIFLADGTSTAGGNFNLNSHKIVNLSNGSNPQDAVAFDQLSSGNAITAGGIASQTITATQIANATITGTQVANQTINGSTANSGGSAGQINQGTISTPDLRSQAVSQVLQTTGGSVITNPVTAVSSISITTSGGVVIIMASASFSQSSVGAWSARLYVARDGQTNIIPGSIATLNTPTSGTELSCSICITDSPGTGTFIYHLQADGSNNSFVSVGGNPSWSFVVFELKK
jgi:hypothetical protein